MDVEKLLYSLLSAALPGVKVAPATDTETVGALPAVLFTATNGTRIQNGARGLGEDWTVALTVLDRTLSGAKATARLVSDALNAAYETGPAIAGAGSVAYLDETSLFRRAPQTEVTAQSVHQLNAVFALTIRPA